MAPSDFFAEANPLSQKISVWLENRTASLVSSLDCPHNPNEARVALSVRRHHGPRRWNDRGGPQLPEGHRRP